jgi:predicted ribosomally synthesized peptide with SipW-like signal peptide
MNISKRRLGVIAAAVGALGALTALGLGGTSALYTSTATEQNNSIESGTIQLNNTSAVSDEIHLTGFMPGDTSPKSKYKLAYAGEDAFVGLDLKIKSTADNPCTFYSAGAGSIALGDLLTNCTGTGTVPMFDGDAGGSMDLTVLPENGNTAHQLLLASDLNPGTTCSAVVGGLVSCTVEKNNVIVPPGYISGAADDLVWSDGTTDSITLQANLPLTAPNIFQGSTVDIKLTAHAVQYANNHVLVAGFEGIKPNGVSGTGSQANIWFPDNF